MLIKDKEAWSILSQSWLVLLLSPSYKIIGNQTDLILIFLRKSFYLVLLSLPELIFRHVVLLLPPDGAPVVDVHLSLGIAALCICHRLSQV